MEFSEIWEGEGNEVDDPFYGRLPFLRANPTSTIEIRTCVESFLIFCFSV